MSAPPPIQFRLMECAADGGILSGARLELPDITGCTALAVRPDVVNAKYHVITNATYNRDPVPAKFKHVIIACCGKLCM